MENFDELYITLSDDDYKQYIQHYDKNISPSFKKTLTKKITLMKSFF